MNVGDLQGHEDVASGAGTGMSLPVCGFSLGRHFLGAMRSRLQSVGRGIAMPRRGDRRIVPDSNPAARMLEFLIRCGRVSRRNLCAFGDLVQIRSDPVKPTVLGRLLTGERDLGEVRCQGVPRPRARPSARKRLDRSHRHDVVPGPDRDGPCAASDSGLPALHGCCAT